MSFKIFLMAALLTTSSLVLASEVQYEVGGGYEYFSGDQNKSLAPKTGYMMRFGAEAGRKTILKWMSNLTLVSSTDTATFNDNGSYPSLAYQLIEGEFNLGIKLAFLAGYDRLPIQPYVGGSGSLGSASFKFADNAAVSTTFPKTDAENFYGYAIFVGVDIMIGRQWGVNLHVEQSQTSGTVAKQAFYLNGNRAFFSLFFQP